MDWRLAVDCGQMTATKSRVQHNLCLKGAAVVSQPCDLSNSDFIATSGSVTKSFRARLTTNNMSNRLLRMPLRIPSRAAIPSLSLQSKAPQFRTISVSAPQASAPEKPTKKPTSSQNPSFESKFKDLGATRTVKIVVIGAISVLATIESIFWAQAGWRWWKGNAKNGGES